MRILGLSGSLRAASSNTAVLQGMLTLDLPNLEFELFSQLSELSHFNPDLDVEPEPSPVQNFRSELRRVQAVVISTPAYAHSLPGPLKNAIDWIVRSGELYEKPVAIVNPSPRSAYAQAALLRFFEPWGQRSLMRLLSLCIHPARSRWRESSRRRAYCNRSAPSSTHYCELLARKTAISVSYFC